MNSSTMDIFISSKEIKEFEEELMDWLSEYFSPIKEGFSSQSDVNIPKDEDKEYLNELKLIIEKSLDAAKEKYSFDASKYLFDRLVKTVIENFSIFDLEQLTDLQEITSLYINIRNIAKNLIFPKIRNYPI